MIKFNLVCDAEHEFEIWFGSNDEYDKQQKRNLLSCPSCGSAKVEKALMRPSVTTARKKAEMTQMVNIQNAQKELVARVKQLRDEVVKNGENVGQNFTEEARKIHYGEAEARGIYGSASIEDAKELIDEGIDVLPIPVLPEEQN
ncbi:MAG: DUF1178 family protein [Rhizobiaceae bacterium]